MSKVWNALEELSGRPTTRASAGYDARARALQSLAGEAHAYLSDALSTDFAPLVVVADAADWELPGDDATPYGIPYASDTEWVVVIPADPKGNFLVDTYASAGSRSSAERFADLIAVHELGHLHARAMGLDLPSGWLTEFLATYLAYCYLADRSPADATLWREVAREHAAMVTPKHRSLETLDELYFDVGPENYIWYQDMLTEMVVRVHDSMGVGFALGLRSSGLGPDSDGPATLAAAESLYAGFDAWAESLRG